MADVLKKVGQVLTYNPALNGYKKALTHKKQSDTQETKDARYEERYKKATDAGMSASRARQYANSYREGSVTNNFWSNFASAFGFKDAETKERESLDSLDEQLFQELLNADYEEKYNSEAAQAQRLQDAGITTSLDGSSISSGEASEINDEVFTAGSELVSSLNESTGTPQQVGSIIGSIGNAISGVVGLVGNVVGVQSSLQALDMNELSNLFGLSSQVGDLGNFLPSLGLTFDDMNGQFQDGKGNILSDDEVLEFARSEGNKRFKSSSGKRIYSDLVSSVLSPSNIAKTKETYSKGHKAVKEFNDTEKELYAQTGVRTKSGYLPIDVYSSSPRFQDIMSGYSALYGAELDFSITQAKMNAEYQKMVYDMRIDGKSLNELKAAKEAFDAKKQLSVSEFQEYVAKSSKDFYDKVCDGARNGDKLCNMLFLALTTPGFSTMFDGNKGPTNILDFLGSDKLHDDFKSLLGFIPRPFRKTLHSKAR